MPVCIECKTARMVATIPTATWEEIECPACGAVHAAVRADRQMISVYGI